MFVTNKGNSSAASETVKKILNQTEENSLLNKDEKFASSLKKDSDILFWVDLGKASDNLASVNNDFAMLNEELNLAGTYFEGNVDFDDGEIISESTFLGNEATKKITELFKKDVASKIVNSAAGENLVGAFSIGLDLEKIFTLLEEEGHTNALNQMIGMTGMTVEDIEKTFTGDIVVSLNGIQSVTSEITGKERSAGADFTGVIGIKDKEKVTALIQMFGAMMGMQEEEEGKGIFTNGDMIIEVTDNKVKIAGTGPFAQKAIKEDAGSLGDAGVVGDHPIDFYLDYTKLPEFMMAEMNLNSSVTSEMETINSSLTHKGANLSSKTVIKMKNKDKNSFSVLLKKVMEDETLM